jgi:hypothetical protein
MYGLLAPRRGANSSVHHLAVMNRRIYRRQEAEIRRRQLMKTRACLPAGEKETLTTAR